MKLVGDGTWPFIPAVVDGNDIVVRNIKGTRFGGRDDGADNGIGASGFHTADNPTFLGVSLPQAGRGIKSMAGCPIPKLPWKTKVRVYSHKTGLVAVGELIDIGPSKSTGHAIDCTNALIHALGLSLADGVYDLDYRVLDGALYVPALMANGTFAGATSDSK